MQITSPSYALLAVMAQVFALFFGYMATRQSDKDSISRHNELKALIQAENKSLRDKLWEKYPFGYVLFGAEGGDIVAMPFHKEGIFAKADWESTQITPNHSAGTIRVVMKNPTWSHVFGPQVLTVGTLDSTIQLVEGKPMRLGIKVGNSPEIYFEIVKNNIDRPIYVIGFK